MAHDNRGADFSTHGHDLRAGGQFLLMFLDFFPKFIGQQPFALQPELLHRGNLVSDHGSRLGDWAAIGMVTAVAHHVFCLTSRSVRRLAFPRVRSSLRP